MDDCGDNSDEQSCLTRGRLRDEFLYLFLFVFVLFFHLALAPYKIILNKNLHLYPTSSLSVSSILYYIRLEPSK